jgi:hypothetical protein
MRVQGIIPNAGHLLTKINRRITWANSLPLLNGLILNRGIYPTRSDITVIELNIFVDESEMGFCAVSYIRFYLEVTKKFLHPLAPYLDHRGFLSVGGLIEKASLYIDVRHPIILPHSERVTELILYMLNCQRPPLLAQQLLELLLLSGNLTFLSSLYVIC